MDNDSELKVLNIIKRLIITRYWLLEELKRFEEKYGMTSREFYEKWIKRLLPEPENPEIHGDFMIWHGLIEELNRVEEELKKITTTRHS